jgi:hypothetical protein
MGVNFNKGRYFLFCHDRGVKKQPRSTVFIIHEEPTIRWWVTRHTCSIRFGPANSKPYTPSLLASSMWQGWSLYSAEWLWSSITQTKRNLSSKQPTNQPTNSMKHSPSWEANNCTTSQQIFRRFITVFTTARHWSLSSGKLIWPKTSYPISLRPIII